MSDSAVLIANPLVVDVPDLCHRLGLAIAQPTQLDYFREVARRAAAFQEQARWLATDVSDITHALDPLAQLEAALDPFSLGRPRNEHCPAFPHEPPPDGIIALTRGWRRIRSAASRFIDVFGVTFLSERVLCDFQTATAALPPSFLAQLADGVALIESVLSPIGTYARNASNIVTPPATQKTIAKLCKSVPLHLLSKWPERVTAESMHAPKLQASAPTLRNALKTLKGDGLIEDARKNTDWQLTANGRELAQSLAEQQPLR